MFDPARFYTAQEVWRLSRAPRELVYTDLQTGRLKAIRRGRRFLVPGECARQWISDLTSEGEGLEGTPETAGAA